MFLDVQIKDVVSGETQTVQFTESPVRIGRNQLNDIPLEDPFVSEWHGIIRFDPQGVAYFDIGSTNGTLLDGKRIPKNVPTPLTPRSCLVLGRHEVTASPRQPAAPSPEPASTGSFHKTIGLGQQLPALREQPGGSPVFVASRRRVQPGPANAKAAPEPARPASPPQAHEQILAAFCEAFVGLRKGFEQFGAEVGVRTVSGTSPLHRARSSRELLDYLLDPAVDPVAATRELIAIFADFGIHHIAMMEGITEGVRGLLQSIDPRAYDLGGGGLFSGSKKAKTQWQSYLEQFDQLGTDDEQLHSAIFGAEFARAYASVAQGEPGAGRRGPRDDGDGD
jgi:predicted component of type VI protein secretion system